MANKLVPEVRIDGFREEWVNYKWRETVNMSTNMVDPKSGQYDSIMHVGPGNIESHSGRLYSNVKTVKEDNLISGKFHFSAGDILYGKINPQLAKFNLAVFEGLASADTYVLNAKNGISQLYLYTIIQTSDFYKYSVSVSRRTGMPKINRDELNQYTYNGPKDFKEQQKIGEFFKQLDDRIALQQRHVEQLKQSKQGFLQKMFPKNGESVPEVRFEEFSQHWELKCLGDLCVITTGKLDANAMVENGDYDFYTSGIKKYKIDVPAFEGPAITVAGNGATAGYMHLADGLFNAYQRTYVLTNFLANREFLYQVIGNELPRTINQEARKGNIPYIVMNMLTNLKIFIPKNEEQQKIGEFFKQLDDLIAKNERELELLQETKKGFLQKMFV